MMDALGDVTVIFLVALALSLLVERLLEILTAAYRLVDSWRDWHVFWTARTRRLAERVERKLRIFAYVQPKTVQRYLIRFREFLLGDKSVTQGDVPVLSGDLSRAFAIKVGSKLVGIAAGVGLAFWMNVDLAEIALGSFEATSEFVAPEEVRIAASGVAIGLGSGPLHKIIATLERKRKERAEKGVSQ